MIAVDWCFRTMPYSMQQTEQIPNDPIRMGGRKVLLLAIIPSPLEIKGSFQFEIIINVLVCSFCLIKISILWVYGHYIFLLVFSADNFFRRQILTSTDGPRAERVKEKLTTICKINSTQEQHVMFTGNTWENKIPGYFSDP